MNFLSRMKFITTRSAAQIPRVRMDFATLWGATPSSRNMGKPKSMAQGWWYTRLSEA